MEFSHHPNYSNCYYTRYSHIFDELYDLEEIERNRIYSGDVLPGSRCIRMLELISETNSLTRIPVSQSCSVYHQQSSNVTAREFASPSIPKAVITRVGHTFIDETHTDETSSRKCSVCKRIFSSAYNLHRHMNVHTNSVYECNICKEQFPSKGVLEKHILQQHEKIHPTLLSTGTSTLLGTGTPTLLGTGTPTLLGTGTPTLLSSSSLTPPEVDRVTTHKEQYVCELCDMPYRTKSGLYRHLRNHRDIKLFKCKVCGKFYSDNRALLEHEESHVTNRPHKCVVCGKGFVSNSYMRVHMSLHNNTERYECGLCNKSFKYQGTVESHRRLHSGEML